jgi:methylamine dehydrogenase light chain
MKVLDELFERRARMLARTTSRRGFLGVLGGLIVGSAGLPLLPIARGGAARADVPGESTALPPDDPARQGDAADVTKCAYWRNCGMDGFLCGCCGGSYTGCPPGTEMSPLTWVGTCRNPADGQDYVVAYHDCCGKSTCNRCMCSRQEGVLPNYVPAKANDINWCMGASTNVYHCTVTLIVGSVREG